MLKKHILILYIILGAYPCISVPFVSIIEKIGNRKANLINMYLAIFRFFQQTLTFFFSGSLSDPLSKYINEVNEYTIDIKKEIHSYKKNFEKLSADRAGESPAIHKIDEVSNKLDDLKKRMELSFDKIENFQVQISSRLLLENQKAEYRLLVESINSVYNELIYNLKGHTDDLKIWNYFASNAINSIDAKIASLSGLLAPKQSEKVGSMGLIEAIADYANVSILEKSHQNL